MSRSYDVVVVGAGIGGLTAAALAAHDGLETLVLEAHNRPGGCAGDFALNGVIFPAGATLISGFEPEGLHSWVYRRLGIVGRAEPLETAMEVVGTEERFTLWTDRERWNDEARRAFPRGHAARERFLRWSETIGGVVHRMASRLPVMPPRTSRDVVRLTMASRPEVLRTVPYLARTVGSVMSGFGAGKDGAFAQFVDAQLLDATGCEAATCAAVNGAIALDLYHRGCFALPGGPAEIARDLVRALRRNGGAIRFETRVAGLRRDAGGVWHVRTAHGETLRARTVISNIPAWDMPALLGEQGRQRFRRAVRLRRHGWGAFVMHAAVDPAVLPASRFAHFQTLPPIGGGLAEGGMCFISVMAPSRRDGAPRAVSVSTHTDVRRWWGMSEQAYREQKGWYAERLLNACERAMPGFRRGVVFQQTATPRTFAQYTLRAGGVVGGVRNDLRHSTFGALSHRSGIAGLYLCGDSVFPGQGTIGVTLSGINAWRSVGDDLGVRRSTLRAGMAINGSRRDMAGDERTRVA
ncbi:MAG: phytoene desaturase family protein [Dehalococcoidia bacterium]